MHCAARGGAGLVNRGQWEARAIRVSRSGRQSVLRMVLIRRGYVHVLCCACLCCICAHVSTRVLVHKPWVLTKLTGCSHLNAIDLASHPCYLRFMKREREAARHRSHSHPILRQRLTRSRCQPATLHSGHKTDREPRILETPDKTGSRPGPTVTGPHHFTSHTTPTNIMTTTTLCVLTLLITLPLIILLWTTESQEQRLTRKVRQYAKKGYSQRQTAAELNVTRYRVRCCLA